MNKLKIIFTKGLQGSGKSYWSKQFIKDNPTYKRVCRDDLRHMISNYQFTDDNEKIVTTIERECIRKFIYEDYNIIIDKMNLNDHNFMDDKRFIDDRCKYLNIDYEIEVKEFPISLSEAIERDSKRDFKIGEKIITQTWKKYEIELKQMLDNSKPKFITDMIKPYSLICDIDSTLSNSNHRKIFGSTNEEILNDKLINPVAQILENFYKNNITIIILSGRKESERNITVNWLEKNNVKYNYLFMRKDNDNREDSIVKKEIFYNEIVKFNPLFVIDDRCSVLNMWQNEVGLFTLNVNQDVYAKNKY